jgi:hypothetical protein
VDPARFPQAKISSRRNLRIHTETRHRASEREAHMYIPIYWESLLPWLGPCLQIPLFPSVLKGQPMLFIFIFPSKRRLSNWGGRGGSKDTSPEWSKGVDSRSTSANCVGSTGRCHYLAFQVCSGFDVPSPIRFFRSPFHVLAGERALRECPHKSKHPLARKSCFSIGGPWPQWRKRPKIAGLSSARGALFLQGPSTCNRMQ